MWNFIYTLFQYPGFKISPNAVYIPNILYCMALVSYRCSIVNVLAWISIIINTLFHVQSNTVHCRDVSSCLCSQRCVGIIQSFVASILFFPHRIKIAFSLLKLLNTVWKQIYMDIKYYFNLCLFHTVKFLLSLCILCLLS